MVERRGVEKTNEKEKKNEVSRWPRVEDRLIMKMVLFVLCLFIVFFLSASVPRRPTNVHLKQDEHRK